MEIGEEFRKEEYECVTGQMAVLPTWPATKILWLKRNRPEVYEKAATYVLLKDYIVYRLTGKLAADCSVATFTFYFDIYNKCYWKRMLDFIGICEEQLPRLVEPCTEIGSLQSEAVSRTGLLPSVVVNTGTLDHFAGMIGTGNVNPGGVSLSTGTVMALAAFAQDKNRTVCSGIAMHYGFRPDTYIMLPVAESGGVSLEWFRRTCMANVDYDMLNEELANRKLPNSLIFLPYLVGTNAPEFDADASGLFYGLRSEHDAYDMAASVMEGVAFLLRKNCDAMRSAGTKIEYIIATGGGARSDIWCQMQADITGLPVLVPEEEEAACLGAALAGAVAAGAYASVEEAASLRIRMRKCFEPQKKAVYEKKYRQFCALYRAMLETARIMES
jgi:sugar (pentulose or hexulose) kinase